MQWGDFVAELWLYVPLIGFWLVAITLGLVAIISSIRDRRRPGGIEYEFTGSEPEPGQRPSQAPEVPSEAPKHSVRLPRTSDVSRPEG